MFLVIKVLIFNFLWDFIENPLQYACKMRRELNPRTVLGSKFIASNRRLMNLARGQIPGLWTDEVRALNSLIISG